MSGKCRFYPQYTDIHLGCICNDNIDITKEINTHSEHPHRILFTEMKKQNLSNIPFTCKMKTNPNQMNKLISEILPSAQLYYKLLFMNIRNDGHLHCEH